MTVSVGVPSSQRGPSLKLLLTDCVFGLKEKVLETSFGCNSQCRRGGPIRVKRVVFVVTVRVWISSDLLTVEWLWLCK